MVKADRSTQSLTKYNPKISVKQIAVAEMAIKHYARAKDATKLLAAIRAKLEQQAEFVLWWDTQVEKQHGGDRKSANHRNRSVTLIAGRDGLPDRMTISRWRAKLNDPDMFEQTYASLCARYPKLLEFISSPAQSHNSGENEWYTPLEYLDAVRIVMGGIDLDPASSVIANRVVKAAQIFTADDDGLQQEWVGRVWLNPPYAQPLIAEFCEKLAASVRVGTTSEACVLVNNATETKWFRSLVDVASAICFPAGRVRFWSPGKTSATPLQGQALLYVGTNVDDFAAQFRSFGFIVETRR